jgi:hypothetical protein
MSKNYTLIIFLVTFALLVAGCAQQETSEVKRSVPIEIEEGIPAEEQKKYTVEDEQAAEGPETEESAGSEENVRVKTEEVQSQTVSGLNPNRPSAQLRLIFIHHSTGENWLRDDYGALGKALSDNNYYVSDTNYGWGPEGIGDRTDIINWDEWFRSDMTDTYMLALFDESSKNSDYTRSIRNPGGENEVIMFKSCFPNSNLEGHPDDEPEDQGDDMTVSNAKFIYRNILDYFRTRPDKLFIIVTAPPLQDSIFADNARGFNDWLVNDYLKGYELKNVAVFDFYNSLTGPDNHHRFVDGKIQHSTAGRSNTLYYPSGDDHPSEEGSRKATGEFVPWLNVMVNCWKGDGGCP